MPTGWSPPAGREDGGTSYRRAIREWAILLAALLALAVGAAVLYSILAEKRYEARADVLVTPLPDDPAFAGLGSLEGSRPAETAARLVKSRQIADAVATRLGDASGEELLDSVEAHAVGDSNVVAIEAHASEGARAAQIANGFADELVARRSARFQSELVARISRLRENLSTIPAVRRDTPRAVSLDEQLARLTPLVGGGDPTLEVVSDAVAPDNSEWPRPWLVVPLAAFLALVVGGLLVALPVARARRAAREDGAPEAGPAGRRDSDAGFERRVADEVERRLERARTPASPVAERMPAAEGADREHEERMREMDDRERGLEEREREVDATRRRLEERVAGLRSREAELARRAAELAAEGVPARPVAVTTPSSPTGPPQPERGGAWNLNELERLVAEGGERHPQRLEEWTSYLFFLRDHAGPDGNLPSSFDWLIPDVFGELLE